MKPKPGWPLFFIWFAFYTALDLVLSSVIHNGFARDQVRGDVEGALAGAAVTWLFALYRWHKADAGL